MSFQRTRNGNYLREHYRAWRNGDAVTLHWSISEHPDGQGTSATGCDACSLDGTPMRLPQAQPLVALDCEDTSPR